MVATKLAEAREASRRRALVRDLRERRPLRARLGARYHPDGRPCRAVREGLPCAAEHRGSGGGATSTVTADPARLDLDAICDFIARSYWAPKRSRDVIERALRQSIGFGVFRGARPVGFRPRDLGSRHLCLCRATSSWTSRSAARGVGTFLMECVKDASRAPESRAVEPGHARRPRALPEVRLPGASCTRSATWRSRAGPSARGGSGVGHVGPHRLLEAQRRAGPGRARGGSMQSSRSHIAQ